jgi:hypothetical protein
MFWAFAVMVPSALLVGVLAGMREGSRTDRSLSTLAIASTATPEYVSGVIFIVLLASSTAGISPWLAENGWIEGRTLFLGSARSAMEDGINFWNFTLPVMTIALYGMGYIARMTRASMAEVMTAQYIRTARLKGVSFRNIVVKHALRNALIAPFTVIMLQFPWLLTGVVIVETLVQLQRLRLDAGAGGLQQRYRAPAGLFDRRRLRGSGDPADLGYRLRLPEPAHPHRLKEGRTWNRSAGPALSDPSSTRSCWPRWWSSRSASSNFILTLVGVRAGEVQINPDHTLTIDRTPVDYALMAMKYAALLFVACCAGYIVGGMLMPTMEAKGIIGAWPAG